MKLGKKPIILPYERKRKTHSLFKKCGRDRSRTFVEFYIIFETSKLKKFFLYIEITLLFTFFFYKPIRFLNIIFFLLFFAVLSWPANCVSKFFLHISFLYYDTQWAKNGKNSARIEGLTTSKAKINVL